MKELKLDPGALTETVDHCKKQFEEMLELSPDSIKLVGVILCFAETNLKYTAIAKVWSENNISDAFKGCDKQLEDII